jgi:hypothetical protein
MFKTLIEAIHDALESSQSGGSMEKVKGQGMLRGKMASPGQKKADLGRADDQRRRADKAAASLDEPE